MLMFSLICFFIGFLLGILIGVFLFAAILVAGKFDDE